jgi:hypothetical protein
MEDGIKKTGRTEQSGYHLEIPYPVCKACPVKHLCTSRTGGREIDRRVCCCSGRNNKRYRENPQLYRTRRRLTNIIFGNDKEAMGLQSHNLDRFEKSYI